MKYKDWITDWLEYKVKPNTKQRTYEKYKSEAERHVLPTLGDYELEQLSALILQKFTVSLTDKGLMPNTVNGVISVVKNSLRSAVEFQVTAKQFSDSVVRPRLVEKQVESFSLQEQKIIERYVLDNNKRKLFGIILCLYTGLRIGELLAITWEDLDLKKGLLSVTKSCHDGWENGKYVKIIEYPKTVNSKRIIPIPKQLLPYLKTLKKDIGGTYVVLGDKEQGGQVRSYQKTFELLLKRLNIAHKGFHSLRHTFATRAIECGIDVKTLSEILGHKNPTITLKRYAHSLLEHKTEMMNKLGKLLL